MADDRDAEREEGADERPDARADGVPADGDAGAIFALLGGPGDGPTLDLDHEQFAYAGKFVVSATGKAVARAPDSTGDGGDGDVLAAASFDRDRTDRSVVRIRYVTVRRDRQGEGLGARLLASLAERLLVGPLAEESDATVSEETEFSDVREVRIAVNNPFAYEAAFKAGFGYTGERTGIAELLCARPGDRSVVAYRRGFSAFLDREGLDEAARSFVEERRAAGPPETVAPLAGS